MFTIIMISGKQGSGKSSLADGLERELSWTGTVYRTRFAKIIYEMHDAVRDVGLKYGIPYPKKFSPLLQVLGTELGRDFFGNDVWTNALKFDIANKRSECKGANFITIIDDLRFENEFHTFDNTDEKVFKIRLTAPKDIRRERCDAWRDNDTHPSEIGLDEYERSGKFDLTVDTSRMGREETLRYVLKQMGAHNRTKIVQY